MPGVRIHHPSARSCVVVVPHPGDPASGRRPKDYRLRIDADGDTIVSETVWRRLEEARGSGASPHEFFVLNEVAAPPKTRLTVGGSARVDDVPTMRQVGDALAEIAPPGTRVRVERAARRRR